MASGGEQQQLLQDLKFGQVEALFVQAQPDAEAENRVTEALWNDADLNGQCNYLDLAIKSIFSAENTTHVDFDNVAAILERAGDNHTVEVSTDPLGNATTDVLVRNLDDSKWGSRDDQQAILLQVVSDMRPSWSQRFNDSVADMKDAWNGLDFSELFLGEQGSTRGKVERDVFALSALSGVGGMTYEGGYEMAYQHDMGILQDPAMMAVIVGLSVLGGAGLLATTKSDKVENNMPFTGYQLPGICAGGE